jgi:Tol biopolymer transport system component
MGLAGATRGVGAQRTAQPTPKFFTKVWESDSLNVSFPALSPDGRWIVFGTYAFGRSNLWVIPATGGTPTALTTGAHVDGFPRWFPSGDKIAFVSDRVGGVMVLAFDTRTGRAVGTPRRVTLEKADRFAISSSGDRIAFIAEKGPGRFAVGVLPAVGGPVTPLSDISSQSVPLVPEFSADDRYVIIATTKPSNNGEVSVIRVPVSGGPPETVVATARSNLWAIPMPARQQVLVSTPNKGVVIGFSGDTNAFFDLGTAHGLTPTPDGHTAFATSERTVAPVRVLQSAGKGNDLTPGRGYDWPYAWSADGKRVFYSLGDPKGKITTDTWLFEESEIDGKNRHAVRMRPTNLNLGPTTRARDILISPDLRYAGFKIDSLNRPDAFTFVIVDLQTGVARSISSRASRVGVSTGGGDWSATNRGEFLYTEIIGDQLLVRGAKPSGETRLIRSLPAETREIAVEGDDIAFTKTNGDSTIVFAAHGTTGESRVVARLRGKVDEISLSPDASLLAMNLTGRDPAKQAAVELAIIPLTASAPSRFIPTGEGGYEAIWTRDGSGIFYLKAEKGWTQMSVMRYSVRGDGPPENLTKNQPHMIWGYVPSPDGKSILIPPEQNKGMTLWRVDLQRAIDAYRAEKGRKN